MTTALVFGKFLPPHRGHQFLAEAARGMADEVIVLVLANSAEPIPVEVRHAWLEEMLPWATVKSGVADHPIDYDDPAVYDLWAATIKQLIGRESVDLLLTSEPAYGEMTAARLGARHVLVDPERRSVPISATAVRADPFGNWVYLAPAVRAWYVKRVCLLGAESTGTTTMTELLAELFETTWVPEYGREYSVPKDARGEAWTTEEFVHIARRQQELEDRAAREANKILFCDTDALATALWHEQYLGERAAEVEEIAWSRKYDLTFLTAADFPWVNDGSRFSDNARQKMQRRFESELEKRPEPVVELRGSMEQRTAEAIEAIESVLGLQPPGPRRLGPEKDSVTLYRPVGPTELARIEELGWRAFPPRLEGQPIFYPVLVESYARQIARDWNATAERTGYRGYVTRFEVTREYLDAFDVQVVGGREHREYWIPAEQLDAFNSHIVGRIEVIAEYQGGPGTTPIEVERG